jgi:putative phosphoribosyl transferase
VAGPTAIARSAAKLEQTHISNGNTLILRFQPQSMQPDKLRDLIKTYFELGGMQLQFNMVDSKTLLDAQANPEKYKDLVVRIAGYSVLFTSLSKKAQDEIISRTVCTFWKLRTVPAPRLEERGIVWEGSMFLNRHDAALRLAERLKGHGYQNPLILGIPRGGVVIASVLAHELKGELDIILTRKLPTPGSPELAMGSIDENGNVHLNTSLIHTLGIGGEIIEQERVRQLGVIRTRAEAYRRIRQKIPLDGRTVIITDDGIATGATMKAALQSARAQGPKRLVAALPVGPPEQVAEMKLLTDETVCLLTPVDFMAVGQFYESFDQVDDKDVERILLDSAGTPG